VLKGLVPQAGLGLNLVTSRTRQWDLTDAFFDVTVLDAETAAAFEQARAGIEDSAAPEPSPRRWAG
jgi:hypothetical protein